MATIYATTKDANTDDAYGIEFRDADPAYYPKGSVQVVTWITVAGHRHITFGIVLTADQNAALQVCLATAGEL